MSTHILKAMRALMFFTMLLPLSAQVSVGRLRGTVKDPSGSVVPGALVLAHNDETGVENKLTTNHEGAYSFPSLSIGTYTVTVSSVGFMTLKRSGVRLVSNESAVVDFDLLVGEVSQSTSVTAELPTVDPSVSTNATARVNEEISNLPLELTGSYRDAQSIITTLSGISFNPAGTNRRTFDLSSINGIPTGAITYRIDGVISGTQAHEFGDSYAHPLPEAVAEFVVTANTEAEYGWNSGAGINLTMKSGTNQLHGSLFEYLRNDALDARSFFAQNVSLQKQNEFGGTFGGPIVIPHLYDGHDRTFFMFSYDGYRRTFQDRGSSASVPTAAMRSGDFSELLGPQIGTDALGRPILQGQIYDPLTTRPLSSGGFIRDPFPGNIIRASRLSPISQNLQTGYPSPNRSGTQLNWVGPAQPAALDLDKTTLKLDHIITSAHRLSFASDIMWHSREIHPGILNPEISSTLVENPSEYAYRLIYDWNVKPNLVFTARLGIRWAPRTIGTIGLPSNTFGARSGIKGVFTTDTPDANIQGMTGFGAAFQQLTDTGQSNDHNIDLAWTKGTHNFRFGASYLRVFKKAVGGNGTQGVFSFSDRETGLPGFPAPATGAGYASFLLGEVDSGSLSSPRGADGFTNAVWGFYVQDQWRVTSKLTLNYGLRWDLYVPRVEWHDRMSAFDPTIPNPAAGGLLGAATFWGSGAGRNGRHYLSDFYYKALGPRFGFAYAITPNTVIRGHYGVAYDTYFGIGLSGFGQPSVGWGGKVNSSSLDNGVTSAFNWNSGFPPIFPKFPLFDPSIVNGSGLDSIDPHNMRPGRTQNVSFGIERSLPGMISLRADYIGNWSHGLPTGNLIQLNQLDPRYFALGNLLLADINSPAATAARIPVPYPGFKGSVAQALRPYPQYQNINQLFAPAGDVVYNSLQVNAQKRLGNGMSFLVAYTFSKSLGNNSFGNSGDGSVDLQLTSQRAEAKHLTELDRPQNLALSYTYELPFGPGKPFARGNNPIVKSLVGGWKVAAIHNYFSGTPIEITTTASIPGGVGPIWALRVPGVSMTTSNGCSNLNPGDPTRNRYLNIGAFATPAPFTVGDTWILPNVRTCGYANENISVIKVFPVRERIAVRFAADFLNAFNRHSWTNLATNIGVPASFGRYSGTTDPRYIQFSLKVQF